MLKGAGLGLGLNILSWTTLLVFGCLCL